MENEDKWYCPLVKREIEDFLCLEVHTVVWGEIKPRVLPKEILEQDFKTICHNCKHYRDE